MGAGEHAGHYARVFPPSTRAALEELSPLAGTATSTRLSRLSSEMAILMYGEGSGGEAEGARRAEMLRAQEAGEEDERRWDWFGVEGRWAQEKAAVREENRELMSHIRAARHYERGESDASWTEADEDGDGDVVDAEDEGWRGSKHT